MVEGIGPSRLLLVRSKRVRVENSVKLKSVSEPLMFALERFIWETVADESQTMEVQLQRLLRLVSDHEAREVGEEEVKLFFHLMRASACVLGDDVIFNGSNEIRRRWKRIRQVFLVGVILVVLSSICYAFILVTTLL